VVRARVRGRARASVRIHRRLREYSRTAGPVVWDGVRGRARASVSIHRRLRE